MKRREIVIEQDNRGGAVTYWLGRKPQSLADRNGISLAAYIHALYGFVRGAKAKRVLLIGCGGGTLATMLAKSGVAVTMLDIDAASFALARRYFHLPERVTCTVMDGARFLRGSETRYDAIVLDAYGETGMPGHFLRRDFFQLVKTRLTRQGIFLVNLIAADDEDRRPDRIGWRLRETFPAMRVLDAEGELDRNVLLLAGRVRALRRPRLLIKPARGADGLPAELKSFDFRPLRA
jgi:cyclopropane fatty-acyl-phospholipid synthase-like methyltransferase